MKAGLVGYGYWGKLIERYLLESSYFQLKTVYSPNMKNNGVYTNNIRNILDDREIEAVFICSPIITHFEYCKEFLLNGKHVFCEKPTAKTLSEFDVLFDIAINQRKILYTDHIYTVSSSVNTLKNLLPTIGNLSGISCRISQYGKFYENETVYTTIGIHLISVILYLLNFNPVNTIFTDIIKNLYGIININCPGNITATIECNLISPVRERTITVYGSDGILHFDMMSKLTVKKYVKSNEILMPTEQYHFDETNNIKIAIDAFNEYIERECVASNLDLSRKVIMAFPQNQEEEKCYEMF
jgi:predicted dehydrogenase